jgi:Flp pilus assembly protein TadD
MRVAALILAGVGAVLSAIPGTAHGEAIPVYAESAADALERNVRILAESPRNFEALLAAGKAALHLGDAQSAAGFFGRAEEVNPNSPLAKAGMGAALVATGDPRGALTHFARAQQLGATAVSVGCDRGLAYDLLGQQVAAQTDYRAAMNGPDRDEARRRLALSLAISGDKDTAVATLQPLLQRRDVAAQRVRALALAVAGDIGAAKTALDYTMPGTSHRMDPFFRRLPSLSSAEKAAAVHLGIFPSNGSVAMATATEEDRLASIEQLLTMPQRNPLPNVPPSPAPRSTETPRVAAPVQVASAPTRQVQRVRSPSNELIQTERVESDPNKRKIWLQLASGDNPESFAQHFRQIRSRDPSLFTGISGYLAEAGARARLVIGPFHTREDARLFADALESARIDSFPWTSQPGQVIRKLPTQ